MSQQTKKLAILFADICGSTSLYERLGDEAARRLIAKCIAMMTRETTEHQGTLVKTIGDEIMCTFPSAEAAIRAACAMQHVVETDHAKNDSRMHIRVGIHYGNVICEAGDVYGDTVNVAARVASITRASQILTTRATTEDLSPDLKEKIRQIMRAELKGKTEQLDIFLVIWEKDDMESTRIGLPAFRKPQESAYELTLHYRDNTLKINEQCKSAVLGRDDACDITARTEFASRQHARINFRFGKLVISDQSTNGTYIRFSDGHIVHLTREDMVLRGSGTISLGQSYSDNPSELIEFAVDAVPAA
ncbi:MAG: adenylate/guanylate cyclase domain-containing protein [Gallionellaceae bacterium]|nr:adenylate/guanylate cyclase domain-containing protein [Gallionellaceae bacterium]